MDNSDGTRSRLYITAIYDVTSPVPDATQRFRYDQSQGNQSQPQNHQAEPPNHKGQPPNHQGQPPNHQGQPPSHQQPLSHQLPLQHQSTSPRTQSPSHQDASDKDDDLDEQAKRDALLYGPPLPQRKSKEQRSSTPGPDQTTEPPSFSELKLPEIKPRDETINLSSGG